MLRRSGPETQGAEPEQAESAPEAAGPTPVAQALLQRKVRQRIQRARAGETQAEAPPAQGGPLPDPLKRQMEGSLGADFSSVRVHEGSEAPAVGAIAYAQGDQLRFAPGQYRPDSAEGRQVIGHELAHVVQQRQGRVGHGQAKGAAIVDDGALEAEADRAGAAAAQGQPARLDGAAPQKPQHKKAAPIQRFGSTEHKSLGDHATGNAAYQMGGGFSLTHGDLVALSGDFFLAGPMVSAFKADPKDPDLTVDLLKLAAIPGERGGKKGTRDEIVWALKRINASDPRFQPGGPWADYVFSDDVKGEVEKRYQALAAKNDTHFAAPDGRTPAGAPRPAPGGSAGSSYRSLHQTALSLAFRAGQEKRPIDAAMAAEAAGQHYLTDSFSAGHARTPITSIRTYWSSKYPLFWYNLRHKMALDTAVQMNAQDTNVTTIVGTVNMMYQAISKQIEGLAQSLPAVTLGDLLGLVFHDYDNAAGLPVQGGGRIYGDGHLDDKVAGNDTRALAERAIREGNADVQRAFALGQAGGAPLPDPELFARVRAATNTGDQYLAETRIPVPDMSAQQNWIAGSIEELWGKPVVGNSGPTVGDKIKGELGAGEIRSTLEGLAQKFPAVDHHASGDLHPRAAYLDGFVKPLLADPEKGLLDIVHWAPDHGLADNSRDDVCLQTGQELDKQGMLGGMTTEARVKYIRELEDGYTGSDEGDLIVRVFETAPRSSRREIYRRIEGHDWTGDFQEGKPGDQTWLSLNHSQLQKLRQLLNG